MLFLWPTIMMHAIGFGRHAAHTTATTQVLYHTTGKVSTISFVFTHHSFIYLRWRGEAAGRGAQASSSQGEPGRFFSATTSILSELDDSASQRHRSVGGFSPAVGCLRETHPPSPEMYSSPLSLRTLNDRLEIENTRGLRGPKFIFRTCRCTNVKMPRRTQKHLNHFLSLHRKH